MIPGERNKDANNADKSDDLHATGHKVARAIPKLSASHVNEAARALTLEPSERRELARWVRSRMSPYRLVVRSRIVLLASRGLSARAIAVQVGVTPATVRLWTERFDKGGLAAITAEAPGRGRPPGFSPAITLAVLRLTRTHLSSGISIRSVADLAGVSASTVWRVWSRHGVKTHSAAKDIDAVIEQLISGTRDTSREG